MQSFIIAFSMYSKIPMPRVKWNDKNMRFAICYFPLIGAVIGAVNLFFCYVFEWWKVNIVLSSTVFTVVPLLLTGGIHLDGFMDTADARSSYQEREKRLEILKDPHIGAFAVISCIIYFLLTVGLFSERKADTIALLAVGYVYERALSGLALVTFKNAKATGLLFTFANGAEKKIVRTVMCIYIGAAVLGLSLLSLEKGLLIAILGGVLFFYYHHMSYREFGGITGDLAGYFVQLCELAFLAAAVLPIG